MGSRKSIDGLAVAFGHAVRSLRIKAGHNQEDFAHRCNMDRAYYGNIERGEHTPTIATLWRIASALNKRPRDVVAAVESDLRTLDSQSQPGIAPKLRGGASRKGG